MKVYRIISLVAIALLATAASANINNIEYTDEDNRQTIKVTTLCNDIMKVEITPDGWDGKRLPSLAQDNFNGRGGTATLVDERDNDITTLTTGSGMRVILDKQLKCVSVSNGSNLYVTDLCERDGKTMPKVSWWLSGVRCDASHCRIEACTHCATAGALHPGAFSTAMPYWRQ